MKKRKISQLTGTLLPRYSTWPPAIGLSTTRITDNHVVLKNGKTLRLGTYRPEDKEGLVSMYASMSPEAIKWGLPPYDRARIERWTSDLANRIILIARLEEKIVGHLQMMKKAIELAKERGFHRIGLTVVADNHRAIKVYEKVGFKKEGIARETFYGDDHRYHDEVEMGLLL
jgi:hypothetical protein